MDRGGVEVAHILADERLGAHESTMSRLLAEFDFETVLANRHRTRTKLTEEPIAQQAERVGHFVERVSDLPRQKDP